MPRRRGFKKGKTDAASASSSNKNATNEANGLPGVVAQTFMKTKANYCTELIRSSCDIVLWRHPFITLKYAFLEVLMLLYIFSQRLWYNIRLVLLALTGFIGFYMLYIVPGPHQFLVMYLEKKIVWCIYWAGLGVLSSIGLGTGLHTFLLYLGPHIASVTLAAYECESLKFPEPPYPEQIICPLNGTAQFSNASDATNGASIASSAISLWAIMSKVRLEAFMWGAGTALGELPPYFMARAARISGQEPDDEEYREFEQLMRHDSIEEQPNFLSKAKLTVEQLVEKVGFFGILLCASIPNPLFDLAGITCGHFLVPFGTFFGATLVGKAVIKMHIQKLFVILTFSEHHVEEMIRLIKYIPVIGLSLQTPFKDYLNQQKLKLHQDRNAALSTQTSWLKMFFEYFVFAMITYFLLSIVNSLAQRYHKRQKSSRQENLPLARTPIATKRKDR